MKDFIITKSKLEKYTGTYMGIGFEINHWKDNSSHLEALKDNWTYYLILHIDRIPEQYNPESFWLEGKKSGLTGNHISYDYYNHPIISEIWLHHGCTFYNKESGFDGANKVIKIGCDYQHYWDEGYTYDLSHVENDIKKSIEDLRNKMPDYKYWCGGNGKLYDIEDGILYKGYFYSHEYWHDKPIYNTLVNSENPTLQ